MSGVLRLLALGLGGAAVGVLLQQVRVEQPTEPTTPTVAVAPPAAVPADAPAPAQTAWSLRAGGWYIRVDGAEVAIPSLGEQTASRPHTTLAWTISPYDRLIVHHANAEGFDWRLIAALIFEESRFDPTSHSDKGAYGLMQVRPIAAEAVGSQHFTAPDDNVKTGVRYLRQLDDMFHDASGRDRLKLVLAAYNMGPGHVRDAQALARRFGYNPNRWDDSMELILPLLEEPAIYQSVPNGFAKGGDTVAYVQRTVERFHQYQRSTQTAPDFEGDAMSSSAGPAANG